MKKTDPSKNHQTERYDARATYETTRACHTAFSTKQLLEIQVKCEL